MADSNLKFARTLTPFDIPPLQAAIVLLAATFVAYWPAINAGFIWDDDQYVTGNALLRSIDGLWRFWVPRQTPQYYPIVFTSFWIEYQLWQLNPMGYHIVNVMLHIANALLIWRVCFKLNIPWGWLVASIFALHPVHVESVAWITERKNVLSAFFYLLSMLAYLQFADGAQTQRRWGFYALSLFMFVMALLSKSVTCSLPAALMLIMLYQHKQLSIKTVAPLVPMFVIGFALAMNTAIVERNHVLAIGPDFEFSIAERLLIATRALLFYPSKLLLPYPLVFVYKRWNIHSNELANYWSLIAVLLLILASFIAYKRGWRGTALALAFYAGTISPALGFINIYPMIFSFVADHFQYFASLGIILLVAGAICSRVKTHSHFGAACVAVLVPLGLLTYFQTQEYYNLETLWRRTIAKNDQAWMAHNNLVPILLSQAQTAAAREQPETAQRLTREAIAHGERAVELKRNDVGCISNLSQAYVFHGDYAKSIETIQRAIQLDPTHADYVWQLGYAHELAQNLYEAMNAYRTALNMDSSSILYSTSLARVMLRRSDSAQALLLADEAVRAAASKNQVSINDLVLLDQLASEFLRANRREDAIRLNRTLLEIANQHHVQEIIPHLEENNRRWQMPEPPLQ